MENKKLTLRKTYWLCSMAWLWQAFHPSKRKTNNPWYKEILQRSLNKFETVCWACKYVEDINKNALGSACIAVCPLYKLWPKGCENDIASPYVIWKNSKMETHNRKQQFKAAMTIATYSLWKFFFPICKSSKIRIGFKSKNQLPLFMVWREYRNPNGVVNFAEVIYSTKF